MSITCNIAAIPGYDPIATAEDCIYDEAKAQHPIDWITSNLKFPEGDRFGQAIVLEPFQEFIIRTIFGWVQPNGRRRYKNVYILLPRGNAKSTLGAMIALYVLCATDVHGKVVIGCAGSAEQGRVVYRKAASMVRQSPKLSKFLKIYKMASNGIYNERLDSAYRVVNSSGNTKHGEGISCCIFDETWAQENWELWEAMISGQRAVKEPLHISISTAGWDQRTPMWSLLCYARDVQSGKVADKHFLPVLYEAPAELDWRLESTWESCNPMIDVCDLREHLRAELKQAMHSPQGQNKFERLYLDRWTGAANTWISDQSWLACQGPVDIKEKDACFIGVDLASVRDLSAVVCCFPKNEKYQLTSHYFLPENQLELKSRIDKQPYQQWIDQGFITATPGEVQDYSYIYNYIVDMAKKYKVESVVYDPRMATELMAKLQEAGITIIECPWGKPEVISPAAKTWERLILEKKVMHDGNPVLRQHNLNCSLDATQLQKDLYRPRKSSETQRIDGISAGIMALDRAVAAGPIRSVYEERGVLLI